MLQIDQIKVAVEEPDQFAEILKRLLFYLLEQTLLETM